MRAAGPEGPVGFERRVYAAPVAGRVTPGRGPRLLFASAVASVFLAGLYLASSVGNLSADGSNPSVLAPILPPAEETSGEALSPVRAEVPAPEGTDSLSATARPEDALPGLDSDQLLTTSVAAVNLDTGAVFLHNADVPLYAASTFKLAVLYEAERRISEGSLGYEDRLHLTPEAIAEDLGTLALLPLKDDGTVSVGEALEAMVTHSDNATAVALMRLLGPDRIDQTLRALGAGTMSVNTPDLPATARDLARLMAAVVNGEGVAPAQRLHMRDLLIAQQTRDGIPAAIVAAAGPGAVVGNKTGTWPGATRDAGFVETSAGTYVVAVMVEGDWNWDLVRRVTSVVHREMTSR